MEDVIATTLLKEFREFRAENNERWENNERRWEENDKRWEENEKRWENNERRWEENEKRWENNERRWEENEKRWENNERRWEENDKRWCENDKRWEQNESRWQGNKQVLASIDKRLTNLEEARKKDRRELIEVLDTMQKSIDNQFKEMQTHFDMKFDKIFAAQRVYELENSQFKRIFCAHEKRLDFQDSKLDYIENWIDQFDLGELSPA